MFHPWGNYLVNYLATVNRPANSNWSGQYVNHYGLCPARQRGMAAMSTPGRLRCNHRGKAIQRGMEPNGLCPCPDRAGFKQQAPP